MKWCINLSGVMGTASSDRGKTSEVLGQENLTMPDRGRCSWGLGIALAFGIGGAITYSCDRSLAQSNIVPDSTLGNENSIVVPNFNGLPVEAIGGGAVRGQNLFHSFQEFNVSTGRGAYFFSPSANIQNILARVTGNNLSQILGTLGTFGNSQPNLFLINPNGIIFGQNASLDVGGSFVATTANAIRLGDSGLFSASEPQRSNLLSINPSAFFFNSRASQAQIVNRSTATTTVLDAPTSGLQVPDGRSLLLVGGDVRLNGGRLFAPGGRVELGGVRERENGTLGLNANGNELRLSFLTDVARANVFLTNEAEVNVRAGGGGSIAINAGNLEILGGSKVRAGIASGLGSPESKAGDIEINATETITVAGAGESSFIANAVLAGGVGKGGDINIITGSLLVKDGGQVNSSTWGQGDAGSVTINARDTVSFDGTARNGNPSAAFTTVAGRAVGNGGGINITTGSLFVTNGAQLDTSTYGQGKAGSVRISASDTVGFDGVGSRGRSSGVLSNVRTGAVGDGGDIEITTGSLSVRNGARLNTSTYGQGKAGSVRISASDTVRFDGVGSNRASSAASSDVEVGAEGDGGDIEITTGSLSVSNGARLDTSTYGQGKAGSVRISASDTISFDGGNAVSLVGIGAVGNGGDIEITTGSLSVSNDARLNTSTFGQGNAGNVTIQAGDAVSFDSSRAISSVESLFWFVGDGNAGNITIRARSLSLTNGSRLEANTSGRGDAGNVLVEASNSVSLADNSRILTNVESDATGNGGDITIQTGSLSLTDGSDLQPNTFGRGNAGNVTIAASGSVFLEGVDSEGFSGGVFSTVDEGAVGKGGDINIQAESLFLSNGAAVNASTFGQGNAGNVVIATRDKISLDGVGSHGFSTGVFSTVAKGAIGNNGNINIQAGSLFLSNGAVVNASTSGQGNGGNVAITVGDNISLDGVGSNEKSSGIFSNVCCEAIGKGGDINIQAGSLSLTNGAQVNASTFGQGDAGNVAIATRDTISLDGVGSHGFSTGVLSTVNEGAVGKGGDINIQAGSLFLTNGAAVNASTFGQGDSGNIAIATRDTISLDGVGSHGFSTGVFSNVDNEAVGNGGEINIQAESLSLTNGAAMNASTYGKGNGGNISLAVRDNVSLDGVGSNEFSSRIVTQAGSGAVGKGGGITVQSRSLSLMNSAQMSASAVGFGRPGNIQINAAESVKLKNSSSLSTFNGLGNSLYGADARGNLRIETGRLIVQDGSDLTVSSGFGDAGNIEVTASSIELDNKGKLIAETMLGSGGNITLNVQDLLLLRRNSQISATSNTARIAATPSVRDALSALGFAILGVDGGNITINAPFIVAVPKEDSDITANAFDGRGGRIRITTQGLFGIQPRPRLTPLSDITASSDLGVDGEVTVNGPDVDPSRGLAELPSDVVDASTQIDRRCTPAGRTQERSSFTITGRGGLPPSPNEPLQGESVVTNWVSLDSEVETNTPPAPTTPKSSAPTQLVEAQGWYFNGKGEVVLTASAPKVTPQGEWLSPPECNPYKSQKSKPLRGASPVPEVVPAPDAVKSQKSF